MKRRISAKKHQENAYLTVCLAMCLTLILALCVTLVEGVRQNAGRLEVECITDIALQSIMAEYHQELFEQYGILAIDTSYGTASCGKERVEEHLRYYINKNINCQQVFLSQFLYRDFLRLEMKETEVTSVSILTDFNGAIFRKSAVDAVKSFVGLDLLDEVKKWMQVIEVEGLEESDKATAKAEADKELADYDGTKVKIKEGLWDTVSVSNPTDTLEKKRKMGILLHLVEDEKELSQAVLCGENLIAERMEKGAINSGNVMLEEMSEAEALAQRFLFQEYLLRFMGYYGQEEAEDLLKYQMEYLIAGKDSDVENLRTVANRICFIREAANVMYLLGSETRQAEIDLFTKVLSSLIMLPQLAPLMETVIVLGWAYAESVYDVKTIMNGGRIPLIKDDVNWHYGLTTALLGELQAYGGEEGLSYEDYLRIFMMFEEVDTLTKRAMNMVEADMRSTAGNACFRLDACYVEIEAVLNFESTFGYEYVITRRKSYN